MKCQNNGHNAIGCVADDAGADAIPTACLGYSSFLSGFCFGLGPDIACCDNSNYPTCVAHTYTDPTYQGYTMFWCTTKNYQDDDVLVAWDASTSGLSPTTVLADVPNTNTSTPTGTAARETQDPTPPSKTPSSGLSMSDKITLGTAIGIGLPAAIAGIIAAWYEYEARERRRKGVPLKGDEECSHVVNSRDSHLVDHEDNQVVDDEENQVAGDEDGQEADGQRANNPESNTSPTASRQSQVSTTLL
ncbi:hypothetical protein GGR52DRAFT_564548 [Hypoxylon sp. FL1284]|nr:hypothetical protein GGR52DRAFT_564548 [Hypoxylon sp. FL1284]